MYWLQACAGILWNAMPTQICLQAHDHNEPAWFRSSRFCWVSSVTFIKYAYVNAVFSCMHNRFQWGSTHVSKVKLPIYIFIQLPYNSSAKQWSILMIGTACGLELRNTNVEVHFAFQYLGIYLGIALQGKDSDEILCINVYKSLCLNLTCCHL